jgi:hypothetical protein
MKARQNFHNLASYKSYCPTMNRELKVSINVINLYIYYFCGICRYPRNNKNRKEPNKLEPVAHACNPRYSGSRDQDDHSTKPASDK